MQKDETILDEEGKTFSKIGTRRAIVNDLSPAATFIAYNYNTPGNVTEFEREAKRILVEVEQECGWMYLTLHHPKLEEIEKSVLLLKSSESQISNPDPKLPFSRINYTVCSDVVTCPKCVGEVVFWEVAVDKAFGKVIDEFLCPHCNSKLTKRNMDRAWVTRFDAGINQTIRQAKQVPVLINYSVGKKRFEKTPDTFDLALVEKIESSDIPYWFPIDRMPEGEESRRNDDIGITHVHHFYTKCNLWVLAAIWNRLRFKQSRSAFASMLAYSAANHYASKMRRFRADKKGGGPLSGTLYLSSLITPPNVVLSVERNVNFVIQGLNAIHKVLSDAVITSQSSTISLTSNNSVDYIFTDPPFGGNLMYSELNLLWEAWLKVFTSNNLEAIVNRVQGKCLLDYQELMTQCFEAFNRALRPGHWMTVEFHNSKNSVWNAIQEALQKAGFVIADVRTLDKQQGTFKQVTSGGAVKQDLIISAYKPSSILEERFKLEAGTEEGVWAFIRTHLQQLPRFVSKNGQVEAIAERQNYLLFDRMVAFHIQRGVTVPLSAAEFYAGLLQRFSEREGMYFLPEQVAEYDRKRMTVREILVRIQV